MPAEQRAKSEATREPPGPEAGPRRAGRRRQWVFRCAAVLVGLTPFVGIECLCVLFDWGRPSLHDDPFVGFRSVRPLFVLNEQGTRYEIPKARQGYFRPESFAAQKLADEYRIFCLGGSTVQGEPFETGTSFPTWLEIALEAADPARRYEVVNCGGTSYATYRLVPILQEVLDYEPDLIILCEGHNEFLEERAFDHIQGRGRVVNGLLAGAARLRTFNLAREVYLRGRDASSADAPSGRPILPTEVEALLDYQGGLAEYHRDDAWRQGVIAHYCFNLARMVDLARDAGVDLILVNPACNIADCPPFKSEHRGDLTDAERDEWESLCEAAREHLHGESYDLDKAIELFDTACRLDPLYAGGFYNLAKSHEAAGHFNEARDAYLEAKEQDVCPLRVLKPMNDAVLDIAATTGTPLVDAQQLFEQRSAHGIVGGEWLVDHVHPGFAGHQLLGDALAEKLIELGKVQPRAGWEEVRAERYREHFDSFDSYYFLRGTSRLARLRAWTEGRVRRLRGETPDAAGPADAIPPSSPSAR
ncbi:MAG: SGNH/GDSL hydrolase family protein [Planctomycetia bacterium]|nr:SGNH/GDSL hydrolase family protein [Planctomycetia bacterium]